MRTLNLAIVLIIAAFFLTNCEQDNSFVKDAEQQIQSEQVAPVGSEEFDEVMETVEFFTKDQSAPEIPAIDSTQTEFKFKTPIEIEATSQVEQRGGPLQCNYSVAGSTYNKSNSVTSSHYSAMGLNASLDGGDEIYYFTVYQNTTAFFDLKNTSANLAMILFRGSRNCSGSACSFRLNQLVARTASSSITGDQLYNVFLTPGTYILVVDGAYGNASHFNLTMNCGVLGDPAVSMLEDFNRYYNGNISPQSSDWLKWNPYASLDGQITGSTNKFLFIERNAYASSSNQPDVLYKLAHHSNGIYKISFDIWVPYNRSGYFNVQKQLSYNNSSNEFGAQVYFYSNGQGIVKIAGRNYAFSYRQGEWTKVKLDVRVNHENYAAVFINNQRIVTFPARWSSNTTYGSNRIAALDFFAHASDAKFWVDNIIYENY
ncbi:MAG: hypothetical protein AAGI49_18925 [Bacteroidota bacterium]